MYSIEKYTQDNRSLLIREADGADAGKVLEFLAAISSETDFLSFGPGEFELTEKQEFDYLEKCSNTDNSIYLLALLDEKIVGILFFEAGTRPRTRHAGEMGTSVLQVNWRMGVFSAILDSFLEWCRTGGVIKKINLKVRTDNYKAVNLYKQKGFSIEGTLKKEMYIDGNYYDNFWMGLEL